MINFPVSRQAHCSPRSLVRLILQHDEPCCHQRLILPTAAGVLAPACIKRALYWCSTVYKAALAPEGLVL